MLIASFAITVTTIASGFNRVCGEQGDTAVADLDRGRLSAHIFSLSAFNGDVIVEVSNSSATSTYNISDTYGVVCSGVRCSLKFNRKKCVDVWVVDSLLCKDGSIFYRTSGVISDSFQLGEDSVSFCSFFPSELSGWRSVYVNIGGDVSIHSVSGVSSSTEFRTKEDFYIAVENTARQSSVNVVVKWDQGSSHPIEVCGREVASRVDSSQYWIGGLSISSGDISCSESVDRGDIKKFITILCVFLCVFIAAGVSYSCCSESNGCKKSEEGSELLNVD